MQTAAREPDSGDDRVRNCGCPGLQASNLQEKFLCILCIDVNQISARAWALCKIRQRDVGREWPQEAKKPFVPFVLFVVRQHFLPGRTRLTRRCHWGEIHPGARASRPHNAGHSLAHLLHRNQSATAPGLCFDRANAVPSGRVAGRPIAGKLSGTQRQCMRAGRPRSRVGRPDGADETSVKRDFFKGRGRNAAHGPALDGLYRRLLSCDRLGSGCLRKGSRT